MPHYCCELCNISTKLKYDFKRHLNTKKHRGRVNAEMGKSGFMVMNTNEHKMNTNEHKKNISHSCIYCGELFKTIPSKRRHELHYCKNRFDNINYKKMFLESKKQMEKEKKHLKKQIEILLTKVGDTTINNTQNIQLNSYGKEDLEHITDTMKTQLLKLPYGMIPKMIEAVHFNEDKPENKNIVLPNKKDNKIKVYTGNKWIYKDKDELLDDLIDGKYFILDNYYDSVIENLSNSNKLNYEKFRTFFDENDKLLHDQLKKECEFVLLNNR